MKSVTFESEGKTPNKKGKKAKSVEPTVPIPPTASEESGKIFPPNSGKQGSNGCRICLNMIVKNESKIIERMFDSVLPIIDTYCICDTGSTDNTIEMIRQYFDSKHISGKIIQEPFRDFGYNRTFALNACETMENVDYILLMDADMILRLSPNLDIAKFKSTIRDFPAHYFFQGCERFYYKNIRLVKNGHSKSYWGVTHEYIKMPDGTQYGFFDRGLVFIDDIGDGGAKKDKFERDVRLLLKGLEDEPNNDRYTFYLANSYKDSEHFTEAIQYYQKRITIGGWIEEIWYSHYAIGNCYSLMGNMESAIYYWILAYNLMPNRIENLHRIIKHYRETGKNTLAYMFYHIANGKRKDVKLLDFLFLEKDVYDYKLDYEMSIVGYYCNDDKYDLSKISMDLLGYPYIEKWMFQNVLNNYKFYAPALCDIAKRRTIWTECCFESTSMQHSTPSILFHNREIYVNVRFVNYHINEKGEYIQQDTIETNNVIYKFPDTDTLFSTKNPEPYFYKKVKNNHFLDNVYVGTEDVRLMSYNNDILYNGNRGLGYSTIVVEHGNVDRDTSSLLVMENQVAIEKNWVLFSDISGNLQCIYQWFPFQLGRIDPTNSELKITHTFKTPYCFKIVRGSTNGVRVKNEIWFICHVVSYEDRRYYYHILVAIDPASYEILRYTRIFTFEREKVEYTLGFVYDEAKSSLVIGYSLLDKTTQFMEVPVDLIENALFI